MPRFVLLRHHCPPDFEKPSHWDLMLQQGDVLKTWELRRLPASWQAALGKKGVRSHLCEAPSGPFRQMTPDPFFPSETVSARQLPDHRLAYLDYEGPIRGNRGEVCRCDGGTFELLKQDSNQLKISLTGSVITGMLTLQRNKQEWSLTAVLFTA